MLRGGATIGVLVVQNRARRTYSEEEVEALQTTAMLLAEMIASGELQAIAAKGGEIAVRNPMAMRGSASPTGSASGMSCMHQPRVAVSKIVADDVDSELLRLETAIGAMRASVDELIDRSDDGRSGEHRDVLEAFRMIAHDRGWLRRLREAVQFGPDGGGRGRAGAERRPRQAAAPDRPLSARPAARPDRHRQSPAASARRPEPGAAARANCRRTPSWSPAR